MTLPQRIRFSYLPYRLQFRFLAGTSRGVMHEKLTFLIRVEDSGSTGRVVYGEIPYFEGLSKESLQDVEGFCKGMLGEHDFSALSSASGFSSVDFGLQQVVAAFSSPSPGILFPSDFTAGRADITINGLVWMGDFRLMLERVKEKMASGFSCIKFKIGAISWDDELELLSYVRREVGDSVTLRVDANGAFSPSDCMWRLEKLAGLKVHSIEQPIPAGDLEAMRRICRESPVPVALDEELIGLPIGALRQQILEYVSPQFIILKPALCFGLEGATDWIRRAEALGIGWWITSALESNVGLDAIAQFAGSLHPDMPQGLGTGALYFNNFSSPLCLNGERLHFAGSADAYNRELECLDWITE